MFRKGDKVITTAEGARRFGKLRGIVADTQQGANTVRVRALGKVHMYHEICWKKIEGS